MPLTFRKVCFITLFTAAALGNSVGGQVSGAEKSDWLEVTLERSARQYEYLLTKLNAEEDAPRSFDGRRLTTAVWRDWTSGFFAGSLWQLYEVTGSAPYRRAAEHYTAKLAPSQHNRRTHDVGFVLNCSFGHGYRLTQYPQYRAVLLQGAATLATRFHSKVGSIQSWESRNGWEFPVIIDNMMNLELLLWAAREAPDANLREIAVSHADTTLRNHFRADASSVHVVNYNPRTGEMRERETHQGAAHESAWARGQAWGLYGFTLLYRETKDSRYLAQAERIAEFIMQHPRLPADKIPYWDFDAPKIPHEPRDASAAAITASALLEIGGYVSAELAARYRAFAEAQLRSLASPPYLAEVGTNGGFILRHSTGNFPAGKEIDVPLNYADYYFLEALLRLRRLQSAN